ncbi:MAG: zf-HC2 domain-containing protein [Candidatus Aminicenantales bacterium]
MNVRCFFLRRKFMPYLEGGLRPGQAGRLEKHLAGCRECADLIARVRAGHQAARRFSRRPDPSPRLPEFEEIWARRPSVTRLSPALAVPALLAVAAGLAVLLVLSGRTSDSRSREGLIASGETQAGPEFTPLAIREFAMNCRDRVVTEGFVHKVYYDEQEQTLHIKLAEGPHDSAPFVICEIRDVRGLTIPQEGSRVRVYGTARFDAQPGRGWHEVNPVMNIAVLNR